MMSFTNPIVAGEELIRSGIRSKDYVSSEAGWRITRDGGAEFNNLTTRSTLSAESILLNGDDLATIIDRLPKGLVGYGELASGIYTSTAGAATALLECSFNAEPGRAYRIYTENNRATNATTDSQAQLSIKMTTDGTAPTTTSDEIACSEHSTSLAGRYSSLQAIRVWGNGGSTVTARLLLVLSGVFGGDVTLQYDDLKIFVEDIGVIPVASTVDRYSGASAAKTFRSFEINPTDSRSYVGTGSGALVNSDNTSTRMYQGDIGVDGNRRAWMWFNQTEIAKLVGVPLADIDYCDVYLNYDHWYYSTGGTCKLGWHTSTSVSTVEPAGGTPSVGSYSWPGRDVGQWVSVLGVSSIMNAINAGTFKGFMIGNTGSSDLHQYGYAHGAAMGAGLRPAFRCGYWKV